ncbi:TetR/AcrR family transcriptional regulator [Amycolatopsis sp. K13G38]|uniref:TetR/AcrR family transcriptional regulator n=1 Tax=Amycolatopsis acididurans TaxID=2724524 RepID=A0ABX1IZT5_9PSEU|nr:TetR/AcrR family transcriptional regulator [Amycolatopsis acididurans]NKQ51625.1 TetR/AcrR family transcriptional regulator [Amycolatopsis acididurans]
MTLRDRQKQQTRRSLLECAKTLFVERGYAAVTIDDITAATGCSRATFYLHFSGKPDILQKIGAETMAQRAVAVYADLDEVLGSGSPAEFTRWMRRAVAWFEANQDILPAWDEAVALEPDFKAIARQAVAELPAAMPRYLASWGPGRRHEAHLRIELLVSQLERFFTRWAVQGTIESTADEAAVVLSDIWFPALVPPERRKSAQHFA